MKKTICIVLAAIALIMVNSLSLPAASGGSRGHSGSGVHSGFVGHGGSGGHRGFVGHGGHGGVGVWFGPGWWGPGWWGPGWWDPYYSYYPPYYPYYVTPQVVAPQEPEEYVQPAPPEEANYWYFCKDPQGYYPYVEKCPKGWTKVIPSTPTNEEE